MDIFAVIIDFFSNLETEMDFLIFNHGILTYFLLFLVIFCLTAFIFATFIPGDSILFATGALVSGGSLDWYILIPVLIAAAFLGNTCNYWIGYFIEERAFHSSKSKIFNKGNLLKAHRFYEKYGRLTIIISQFVPFVRSFAPFVAGIARMNFKDFLFNNLIGGILWVSTFCVAGILLGNIPFLRENSLFFISILFVFSLILFPVIVLILRKLKKSAKSG